MSGQRLGGDPVLRAITPLAERDWEVYARTLAHAVVGGWDAERAPHAAAFAELVLASIRPEEFWRFVAAMRDHDVSDALALVRAPTLAMTRDRAAVYTVPVVSEVAAGIPGAKFVATPGNWLLPCTGDDITEEIARFMGVPRPQLEPPPFAFAHGNGRAAAGQAASSMALSQREREVIALIASGKTNAEIAEALVIAPATASRHVHNILGKLGMSRRAEAAAYAVVDGLVPGR